MVAWRLYVEFETALSRGIDLVCYSLTPTLFVCSCVLVHLLWSFSNWDSTQQTAASAAGGWVYFTDRYGVAQSLENLNEQHLGNFTITLEGEGTSEVMNRCGRECLAANTYALAEHWTGCVQVQLCDFGTFHGIRFLHLESALRVCSCTCHLLGSVCLHCRFPQSL